MVEYACWMGRYASSSFIFLTFANLSPDALELQENLKMRSFVSLALTVDTTDLLV